MKKDINKTLNKLLILSLFLSIIFIAGIPMIIFGALNNITLMVFGIIFTAFGFYGSPLSWVNFFRIKYLKSLFFAITQDKIYSVLLLSQNFNKKPKQIANDISELISKRFLTSFIFDNKEVLKEIKATQNKKIIQQHKCPNCGASINTSSKKHFCNYCNTKFDLK